MLNALWSDDIELNVQIGLGLTDDNVFTLDDPKDSQLDFALLGSPDSPYFDVTCDVRALSWRGGAIRSDGILTRWEAGSAAITLNPDLAYEVQPGDPPRLTPMVPVRIRARLHPTDSYTALWMGYADSFLLVWDDHAQDSSLIVTATDGTKLLAAYNGPEMVPPVGTGDTAAQRCARILDECEWRDARRITDGGHVMGATSMAADGWTQLLLNQDAELGDTFVAQDGALVFRTRQLWFDDSADPTIAAKWGPGSGLLRYEDAHLTNDDQNLRNIVDAARAGGTQVTVRDDASVTRYLAHRWGRNDLPFATDADVSDWANLVLSTSSVPTTRIDQLVVLPQTQPAELWPIVLAADYGQHWQVTLSPPETVATTTRNVQVRGWQHQVDNTTWRVTYQLTEAMLYQAFILDSTNPNATLDVMRLI